MPTLALIPTLTLPLTLPLTLALTLPLTQDGVIDLTEFEAMMTRLGREKRKHYTPHQVRPEPQPDP